MPIKFLLFAAVLPQLLCSNLSDLDSREMKDPDTLMKAGDYARAEQSYRQLLETQKIPRYYAGLAESLLMQKRQREASKVLREARDHDFSQDENISAVSGHSAYLRAQSMNFAKYLLYLEAAEVLCNRALSVNPNNQIALSTLKEVQKRAKKFETAKAFERLHDTDSACAMYESILKERSDDAEAQFALYKLRPEKKQSDEPIIKYDDADVR